MICRSPVTICFCCLSAKGKLLHLHSKLSGFVKNTSNSRSLTNLLNLENLVDKGVESVCKSAFRGVTISGSCDIQAILINFTPFFQNTYCKHFQLVSFRLRQRFVYYIYRLLHIIYIILCIYKHIYTYIYIIYIYIIIILLQLFEQVKHR